MVPNEALVQLHTEQVNKPDATQPLRSREEWVASVREMDRLQFLKAALAIKLADSSGIKPAGQDVRKFGHSIAFARHEDPGTIIKKWFLAQS